MIAQLKLDIALKEAEKLKSKSQPKASLKKKEAPKKKGKGEAEEEEPKVKEKTRDDVRILSQMVSPYKNDKYEFMMTQMQEVIELKDHLARN